MSSHVPCPRKQPLLLWWPHHRAVLPGCTHSNSPHRVSALQSALAIACCSWAQSSRTVSGNVTNTAGRLQAPSAVALTPVHCLCLWPLAFVVDIPPLQPVPVRQRGSAVPLPSTLGWATLSNFSVDSLVPFSTYFFLFPLLSPLFVPLIVFPCSDFSP